MSPQGLLQETLRLQDQKYPGVYTIFRPLIAAGASYFCRHKSNQKGFQQKGFFAHVAFAHNQAETRAVNFGATIRSRWAGASAELYYALSGAQAILILPDFIRSWSADGGK